MALNLGSLIIWSLAATGALTVLMALSQGLGWTRLSLPFLLGSMVSSHRGHAMLWGILMHLGIGMISALPYGFGMEDLDRTGWWIGAIMGVLHGSLVLTIGMPLLPYVHPRMASEYHGPTPTQQLEPPGFLARNYGNWTAALTFVGHILYGSIICAFYQLSGQA